MAGPASSPAPCATSGSHPKNRRLLMNDWARGRARSQRTASIPHAMNDTNRTITPFNSGAWREFLRHKLAHEGALPLRLECPACVGGTSARAVS